MTFLFWLAAATLLITILAALDLVRGNNPEDATGSILDGMAAAGKPRTLPYFFG